MRKLPTAAEIEPMFEEMREPQGEEAWGFFVHEDDKPPRTGFFCWFDTYSELIDFIDNFPMFWESDETTTADSQDVLDRYKAIDAVRAFLEKSQTKQIDESNLSELNSILRGNFHIAWLGQFGDLTSGDHPYARRIRNSFFQGMNSAAIPKDKIRDFIWFLKDWGELHDM